MACVVCEVHDPHKGRRSWGLVSKLRKTIVVAYDSLTRFALTHGSSYGDLKDSNSIAADLTSLLYSYTLKAPLLYKAFTTKTH